MGYAEQVFLDELMDFVDRRFTDIPQIKMTVEVDSRQDHTIVAYVEGVRAAGVGPYPEHEARQNLDVLASEVGTRLAEWDASREADDSYIATIESI
jgi:hypothetical protein